MDRHAFLTTVDIVNALGGDPRTGMGCCPAHDDEIPSLHVTESQNGKLLFHCFAGCPQAAVVDALRCHGLWPIPGTIPRPTMPRRRRSDDERRDYALKILADTQANRGRELAEALDDYFARRGIERVPATAMLALPYNLDPQLGERLVPDEDPAMVFEITDGVKTLGCHVTWLNPGITAKRDKEPTRQSFGPVGGGFIKLYTGELEPTKLVIAEGVETAMAAAQIAHGLPAIAGLSATNMPKITPPLAREYIIAADHDTAGLRGARALAYKLVCAGHVVRIAIPPRPDSDWNDAVM